MSIQGPLGKLLPTLFSRLNTPAAAKSFPAAGSLAAELENLMPPVGNSVKASAHLTDLFAAAAVEMWLRSVHSFMISASLTGISPIWASASGYYSSHYSIRAIAHLLGYFQLYRRKRTATLAIQGGTTYCTYERKAASDREHKAYWRLVKNDANFVLDPLFTLNEHDSDVSDVSHRDRANYADLIHGFPPFAPLQLQQMKDRIEFISQIEFSSPPIPRRTSFPDLESVQIVAYHRLVRFRCLLNDSLGAKNRFWNVHRNPTWADGIIDFQLVSQRGLGSMDN
jgi:hypothetical protein